MTDPTLRFGDRVDDYVRYRPGYPADLVDLLIELGVFEAGETIVELGAGTGLLTAVLLDAGHPVHAVEPNGPMRDAMVTALGDRVGFAAHGGRAEATGLENLCADAAVAAQAFHWFDPVATAEELRRVLRPPHRVALMWNRRRTEGDAFSEGYEAMLQAHGTDYRLVDHRKAEERVGVFFRAGTLRGGELPNAQVFDRDGVIGRLRSSSYSPRPEHPDFAPMMSALDRLLDGCAVDGKVTMTYDLRIYCGQL